MIVNIVERIATEVEGPFGNEGGVDKLVMTWGSNVNADALVRMRWINKLYAGSKSKTQHCKRE